MLINYTRLWFIKLHVKIYKEFLDLFFEQRIILFVKRLLLLIFQKPKATLFNLKYIPITIIIHWFVRSIRKFDWRKLATSSLFSFSTKSLQFILKVCQQQLLFPDNPNIIIILNIVKTIIVICFHNCQLLTLVPNCIWMSGLKHFAHFHSRKRKTAGKGPCGRERVDTLGNPWARVRCMALILWFVFCSPKQPNGLPEISVKML